MLHRNRFDLRFGGSVSLCIQDNRMFFLKCVCLSATAQERTAVGAFRAVYFQQAGRWTPHSDHSQHPAR